MIDLFPAHHQIHFVTNFQDLVSAPFQGETNAFCWSRKLIGNFSEIVDKVALDGNVQVLEEEELQHLRLSEAGHLAREMLLHDLKLLKAQGGAPILNVVNCYERDDANPLFPTDVYSFHVDRSPVPVDTFLCTYHGEPSELLPMPRFVPHEPKR